MIALENGHKDIADYIENLKLIWDFSSKEWLFKIIRGEEYHVRKQSRK
jgi:hypothetical protein